MQKNNKNETFSRILEVESTSHQEAIIQPSADYYRVEKALQYIYQNMKSQPSLREIAKHIGINEYDLQKTFKRWAGVSPKKFLEYLTLEHAKRVLESSSIEEATYSAGLSSTSRLHDLFINIEAVTPAEYKNLGKNLNIKYGFHQTHFGEALIAITNKGVCYLNFVIDNNKTALDKLGKTWPNATLIDDLNSTIPFAHQIFENKSGKINLFLKGTNFQLKVWKALLEIPEGGLSTYQRIAKDIKNPKALRAVGTAIGHNPIAYVIPCHRVINSIGKIGNYSAGLYRKPALLGYESAKSSWT